MRNLLLKLIRQLGLLFGLLVLSGWAFATPIRPDLREILRDAQTQQYQYMPARAGWNGPEAKPKSATLNPTYEKLKYADSPQALRREIRSLLVPDLRAVAALMFLVLALRFIKMRNHPQFTAATSHEKRGELIAMPRRDPSEQAA